MKLVLALMVSLQFYGSVRSIGPFGCHIGLENRDWVDFKSYDLEVGDVVSVIYEADGSITVEKRLDVNWRDVVGDKPIWRECPEIPEAGMERFRQLEADR